MIRLAVLGSTRGTNLRRIVEAIEHGQLDASIEVVISNKAEAPILDFARSMDVPAIFVDPTGLSRAQYDDVLLSQLKTYTFDLIVLVGYMRILSPHFVEAFRNKMINVHPSLLPAYGGMMDMAIHEAVIKAKETTTGCTVHIVTEGVDKGPILVQKTCAVLPHDTPAQLKQRVQDLEALALIDAITQLAAS